MSYHINNLKFRRKDLLKNKSFTTTGPSVYHTVSLSMSKPHKCVQSCD